MDKREKIIQKIKQAIDQSEKYLWECGEYIAEEHGKKDGWEDVGAIKDYVDGWDLSGDDLAIYEGAYIDALEYALKLIKGDTK